MIDAKNVVSGEVVCGAEAACCICALPPHPTEQAHECALPSCGGSWRGNYATGEGFDIIRLPNIFGDAS